ncbi:hypothetical protein [Limnohabitans sp.]|jgi:hypothetical protein|uniref:hypothetical protein n=1 Tax=Limnohabitans sp. TaxID=1907725 RepID=UPI0037BF8D21
MSMADLGGPISIKNGHSSTFSKNKGRLALDLCTKVNITQNTPVMLQGSKIDRHPITQVVDFIELYFMHIEWAI